MIKLLKYHTNIISLLAVVLFCLFQTKSIAQTGLVGCYPLDNNANDYSGNNYNGTAFSVTATTDRFGNANSAYNFSGSGSYISIPASGFVLNEYTYSAWCKPTSLPASGQVYAILTIGGNVSDQYIGLINDVVSSKGFHFTSYDNTGTAYNKCSQGFLPAPNQWYHIVATRDIDSLKLYVDGNLIASQYNGGNSAGYLNSTAATIGSRLSSTLQNFVGDIDNVKIFNRALSLAEILSMPDSCNCTLPTVNLGNDTSICSGSSLMLDAGNTGAQYLWSTGDTSQTISVNTNGNYWVQVGSGICTTNDTINVNVIIPSPLNLGNDTSICSGSSLMLDAGNTGAKYLWSTGDTTQTISVNTSGSYSVEITDNFCPVRDTIVVNFGSSMSVNLGADTTLCIGDILSLNANIAGNKYLWSTGDTTQTITVNTDSAYWVRVGDSTCFGFDTINVLFNPPPVVDLGSDTFICIGNNLQLNASTSGATYNWSTGVSTPSIAVSAQGLYTITVTIGSCKTSDSIMVNYFFSPSISAFPDTTIKQGQSVQLGTGGNGIVSYSWSPSAFLDNPNIINPTATPLQTTVYYVTATDSNGCKKMDSVRIAVEIEGCKIFLPNTFSPDENGFNDVFYVRSNNPFLTIEIFSIYDRWGENIFLAKNFSPNDKTKGWDGTYKGRKLNSAVFVYYLRATCPDGNTPFQKGNITLVR